MSAKNHLKKQKMKYKNWIAGLLTTITFGSLIALILLPIYWILMWTINSLFSFLNSTYAINYWMVYFSLGTLFLAIVIFNLIRSAKNQRKTGKLWQHDADMRYIDDYVGGNYDYYSDPYDF
jgi:cobalamin biosynthesis protein CobD/CbiB